VSNASATTSVWETDIENGSIGEPRFVALAGGYPQQPPVVAGAGRFIVWGSATVGRPGGTLVAVDRLTGAVVTLPEIGTVVNDPTATRLFAGSGAGITAITASGTTVLADTVGLSPVAIADHGGILYATSVVDAGPPALSQLHALDPTTGARIGSMPIGANVVQALPSSDGASVWILADTRDTTPVVTTLRHLAVPSGVELLAIELASLPFNALSARIEGVNTTAGRVFVSTSLFSLPGSFSVGELRSFDTTTGAEVGNVELEGPSASFLDKTTSRLLTYAASRFSRPSLRCGTAMLHLTDASTGQQLSATSLGTDACLHVTFATPPPPPVLAPVVVTSTSAVTLSWTRTPELLTQVTIEAGSAPGLSDLAVLPVTTGTSLTIPNVPPGTYYVRATAWNHIGASVASNEIVVSVP
jgi:hypothetical protein